MQGKRTPELPLDSKDKSYSRVSTVLTTVQLSEKGLPD
jgi:hypothetical protein